MDWVTFDRLKFVDRLFQRGKMWARILGQTETKVESGLVDRIFIRHVVRCITTVNIDDWLISRKYFSMATIKEHPKDRRGHFRPICSVPSWMNWIMVAVSLRPFQLHKSWEQGSSSFCFNLVPRASAFVAQKNQGASLLLFTYVIIFTWLNCN
jgi:hypothetical protein